MKDGYPFETIVLVDEHDDVIDSTGEEIIRCKDCKYFELDHFDMICDMPLITAHEICTKWGGGCKTSKDGFCFMAERKNNDGERREGGEV